MTRTAIVMPLQEPVATTWFQPIAAVLLHPATYGWVQGIATLAAVFAALGIAICEGRQLRNQRDEARAAAAKQELATAIGMCRMLGRVTLALIDGLLSVTPSHAELDAQIGALRETVRWPVPPGIDRLPIEAADAFLKIRNTAAEFGPLLDASTVEARASATHWEALISTRRTRVSDALNAFEAAVAGYETN